MLTMTQVGAIVVAGGASRRFGSDTPKQFLQVSGKPLLAHTVSRIVSCHSIQHVVVVLPAYDFEFSCELMQPYLKGGHIDIVAGGANRHESVYSGLKQIQFNRDALVVVHDGVRPLVDEVITERVILGASKTGGAITAIPIVDTLKVVSEDMVISSTVNRLDHYRAQTPQCFRVGTLLDAFEQARRECFTGTDEASLLERCGIPVQVVIGSVRNIKVTNPEDLDLVRYFLSSDSI